MNFSVNVDAIYLGKKTDIHDAVEDVAKAGIKNIEFWGWWDKDLDRLCRLKEKYGLQYVGLCPRLTSMVDAQYKEQYLADFGEALKAAEKIGCTGIFVKPGDKTKDKFEVQARNIMDILRRLVDMATPSGITVLLEPVSFLEAPDTFLGTSKLAFQMVREIDSPYLKVLYDLYHMQLDEGDITRKVLKNLDDIGHLHAAGITDRHELGEGEIDYGYVFDAIDRAGYEKMTGLEYFPVKDPLDGLKKVIFEKNYR